MIFRDRQEAGQQLARKLGHLSGTHPLVLALPRGGVPVAYEIATALGAELDLLFVRKLGAPGHEELGIGAVVDGAEPQLVLNEDVIRALAPSPSYLRAEMQRQLVEISRRRDVYLHGIPPIEVARRTVILVDDGVATGGTIRAALKGLRKLGPQRLILAVPVGPPDTMSKLRHDCDELICLAQPEPFYAVGAHYAHFDQTSDEEVVRLMQQARKRRAGQMKTDENRS